MHILKILSRTHKADKGIFSYISLKKQSCEISYRKMLKFLIPTDFSETADNAFRYALHFADRIKAELYVLHVYEAPQIQPTLTLPYAMEEIYQRLEVEVFENFKDYIPHLKEIAASEGKAHVPMSHIVLKGDVKDMIKETVEKENIDIIIMGTQGAGMIQQFFFGNQTIYMLERSPIPVLAIPPNISPGNKLSSIALATNYKKRDYLAMDWLIEWGKKLKLNLHSLHLCIDNDEELEKKRRAWNDKYEEQGVACFHKNADDFLVGLDRFKNEQDIQVIAMLTRNRSFFYDLFNKNLPKEVVYSKNTALLAIPEEMLKS